jgi:hypothetical protein
MRSLIFTLSLFAVGCQHNVKVQDQEVNLQPGHHSLAVGPSHRKLEINSAKGKRLLNIDVFEDGKQVDVNRDEQQIIIGPRR